MTTRTRSTSRPSVPVPVEPPTVAPLGTAARIAKIRAARPDMTPEQAQITAMAMEMVTLHKHIATLDARVYALTAQVEAVIKYVMTEKPIFAKVETVDASPVVETPAATKQRMNPTPAAPAPISSLLFTHDAKLLGFFAAFVKKYGAGRGALFTDGMLAKGGEVVDYLLGAANEYLDVYEGGDTFLVSVSNREVEDRTVRQLRGVLNNMLADYKATLSL